ncbi:hypothetical protein ACJIZ3_021974 [Penstemon smallii]|uniref:THO1-MOS11 C-terminal domain-containing protein n=1 Tax=Penstemon smallii TaxID=265156 RepID=A0ABD3SN99_9LAMI
MATAAVPEVENPSDLSSMPPTTEDASSTHPPPSSDEGVDEAKVKLDAQEANTSDVNDGAAVTDIEKKMKRAEHFGVAVKLSEVEKRNSRAERFGIVQSASANEEGKKKARSDRFGSSQTDSVEEDKKKARAIRFSRPDSGAKSNEKVAIEATAIAGKAGGET